MALALTVILNAVKDLLYVLTLETDNKQILRRGTYPEHGRRAPQNDTATGPADRRQSLYPQFLKQAIGVMEYWSYGVMGYGVAR